MPGPLSLTLKQSIGRSPATVYDFASNPENLPLWLTSFCKSVRHQSDGWVMETTAGLMGIEFVPKNSDGKLDHRVRLPSGEEIHNTMRVLPEGQGSEVSFVLVQSKDMSAEQFEQDADKVREDLRSLKKAVESQAMPSA